MNWRVLLTVALVILGLAATYNLVTRGKVNQTVVGEGGAPDYILKNFELIALDANGKEAFSVRAPQLTRAEHDQHLELITPDFLIPPSAEGGNSTWKVKSQHAWVRNDNEEIRLKGDVIATTTTPQGKPLRVDSQQLNVYPRKQIVSTPILATVNQPGLRITGQNGLEAHMQSQRVIIKSMKAHYNGR